MQEPLLAHHCESGNEKNQKQHCLMPCHRDAILYQFFDVLIHRKSSQDSTISVTIFNKNYGIFDFVAVSGDSGDTSGTGSTAIASYSTRGWLKMEANYLL